MPFAFLVAFLGKKKTVPPGWVGKRFVCWFSDGYTQRLTESGSHLSIFVTPLLKHLKINRVIDKPLLGVFKQSNL